MDLMVSKTQDWLWKHYGGYSWFWSECPKAPLEDEEPDPRYGKTGWHTIYALLRAFQHELGISSPVNSFGPTTKARYEDSKYCGLMKRTLFKRDPKFAILQGALWCKGYSSGHYADDNEDGLLDDSFDEGVEYAVKVMQEHAGLKQTGVVSTNLLKALFSMDSFKLLEGEEYGSDSAIRGFQQMLNGKYEAYTGLNPCDGIYARQTNKAVILAIQAEEKMPVGTANGVFGPSTQRCLPTLPYQGNEVSYTGSTYSAVEITQFTKIMQFGLYVNGYGNGIFGVYNEDMVRQFQDFYKIPVTGVCDKTTWMSIFLSSGDTSRSCEAFDCSTRLDRAKITTLKNLGYTTAGRYLSNFPGGRDKRMTRDELTLITQNGLHYFCIYQQSPINMTAAWLTSYRAQLDAGNALDAAYQLGIPHGAIIYFAIDFDAMEHEIKAEVINYFRVINSVFSSLGAPYRVGVYGPRNVGSKVAAAGLSVSSFVSDMSTGYSGNLGYKIPDNWAFDQFYEPKEAQGTGAGAIFIDKVAKSGRYAGENSITDPVISPSLPYTTPELLEEGVETGGGHCGFFVNTSKAPLPVSAELVSHIVQQPGEVTAHINQWECFTMSRKYKQSATSVYAEVWYRGEDGNMEHGYVRTGYFPNSDLNDEDLVWQRELFDCQVGFGSYVPSEPGAAEPLVKITSEHPRNIGGATQFTLSAPAQVFTPHKYDSVFHTYLNIGDEVLVDRQPGIGSRGPWRIRVLKYRVGGSGAWREFFPEGFEDADNPGTINPELTWAWMDARLDIGNTPADRLLR